MFCLVTSACDLQPQGTPFPTNIYTQKFSTTLHSLSTVDTVLNIENLQLEMLTWDANCIHRSSIGVKCFGIGVLLKSRLDKIKIMHVPLKRGQFENLPGGVERKFWRKNSPSRSIKFMSAELLYEYNYIIT